MTSRSKITLSIACVLFVLIAVGGWQYWSHSSDGKDEGKEIDNLTYQRKARPIPPLEDLNKVTRGGEREDHSWALGMADKIARERIELSSGDVKNLMDFIAGEKPASLDDGQWQHRVNSVLNALRAQHADNDGLSDLLMKMAVGHEDPVLRLYALQHLGSWVAREKDPAKRQQMLSLLSQLATKDGEPTAGTAIQMITELEQAGIPVPSINLKSIEKAALKIVADPKASQDLRVSALHTCCDRNLTQVLENARKIASDKKEVTIVRKAAIYSIGKMGAEEDLEMLDGLLSESRLLSEAVKPAIKRIKGRSRKANR